MPLPRFRLRTLMIAVAVAAVASYSAITAYRVHVDAQGRWLYHVWERKGLEGFHLAFGSMHAAPFWPRYWRRLLGRPWPGTYVCDPWCTGQRAQDAQIAVTVSMADPTVLGVGARRRKKPSEISKALEEYDRLIRERATRDD